MISQGQLARLNGLIAAGREAEFYSWRSWRKLSADVRRLDNNECQICKAHGRYKRGYIVHHVQHLTTRPDLALSVYDPDTGERQLLTVCKQCHEDEHPEALRWKSTSTLPVTTERWD